MTQPPETPVQPPAPPPPAAYGPPGPRANIGPRFAADQVDVIIVGVVALIGYLISRPLGYVLWLGLGLVYFSYFEGSPSGQTPGKKVLGIRVVDFAAGGPIGFGRGVIRYLGKILAGIPCYLGFFWMLWDKEKQCWQDKIATTVVVPESAYPVEKWPG